MKKYNHYHHKKHSSRLFPLRKKQIRVVENLPRKKTTNLNLNRKCWNFLNWSIQLDFKNPLWSYYFLIWHSASIKLYLILIVLFESISHKTLVLLFASDDVFKKNLFYKVFIYCEKASVLWDIYYGNWLMTKYL